MSPKTRPQTSRLRLAKDELFRHVGYEPHPGQQLVHDSTAPRRVLAAGVRWGKSEAAAMELVAALLEPAESRLGWLVAPTYNLCMRIHRRVEATLRRKFAHRIVEVRPREHSLVVRNLGGGLSELCSKSADNPTSLLGAGLDFLVIDEAARLKREIWELHLSQRLIDRSGWALFISTPRGRDWFFRLYRRAERGSDPAYEGWRFPSWQSPLVDAEAVLAEKDRLPGDTFQQEYGARFIGEELEPCDVCGGVREGSRITAVLNGDEPGPRCPDCGLILDDRGIPIGYWHNGKLHRGAIVRIHEPTAEELGEASPRA